MRDTERWPTSYSTRIRRLIAWCMCETREKLERMYRNIPPTRGPVTYPLDPARIARASIDVQSGAAALLYRCHYADAGLHTGIARAWVAA